jgi:hypothetical protein
VLPPLAAPALPELVVFGALLPFSTSILLDDDGNPLVENGLGYAGKEEFVTFLKKELK